MSADDQNQATGTSDTSLPKAIVEAIAITNTETIAKQPANLSNLAYANQVFNTNLQQQMMINQQQAMNQVIMAAMAKCVSMITTSGANESNMGNLSEVMGAMENMSKVSQQLASSVGNASPSPSNPEKEKEK